MLEEGKTCRGALLELPDLDGLHIACAASTIDGSVALLDFCG